MIALLEKIFGKSWRTSFWATLAFLAGVGPMIVDYFTNMGMSSKWTNTISFIFALIAAFNAKDQKVTGVPGAATKLPLVLLCLFLFTSVPVQASPFLVCDPPVSPTDVTYYEVRWNGAAAISIPIQADGSIKMDLAAAPNGTNSMEIKACVGNATWGGLCSTSVPFSFTRPQAPASISNIRLLP